MGGKGSGIQNLYEENVISYYPNFAQIHDFYLLIHRCSSLGWQSTTSYKDKVMTLLNIPSGTSAQLVSADEKLCVKLMQYGLHLGDPIKVVRVAPFGGPLLVEIDGREIALGRTVAEKIFVEAK